MLTLSVSSGCKTVTQHCAGGITFDNVVELTPSTTETDPVLRRLVAGGENWPKLNLVSKSSPSSPAMAAALLCSSNCLLAGPAAIKVQSQAALDMSQSSKMHFRHSP